ncbi:NAC domain-containing protein 78-like [Salvia hispanica]|uniref:NAC domain-containing protein 78-like n=1 Tax=Salvia hispanica TaxID=49212 RepID=UPI002009839A|nr:NAC domain-containing protein 78-like [Salvia hispanica]XP_047953776.1 NAC domain-containing protein 78-like [Salvia hispanica]
MLVKGFEFNPSGEDLINFYLYPCVKQQVPWNGIPVKEIYGPSSDPWVVFYDVESRWHSRLEEKGAIKYTIYAFTFLSRVSKSKRVSRKAGTGTWHGQTGPEMIQDSKNGQIIGQSKMLAFKHPGSDADFGHWTLHEYSLGDNLIRSSGVPNAADLVVCRITKTVKKKNNNNKKSGAQPPLAKISKLPELRTTEMFLPESQGNGVWVQPPQIVNHAAVRDPFDVSDRR